MFELFVRRPTCEHLKRNAYYGKENRENNSHFRAMRKREEEAVEWIFTWLA